MSLSQVQQSLSITSPLWFTPNVTLKQSFVDLFRRSAIGSLSKDDGHGDDYVPAMYTPEFLTDPKKSYTEK